jgi:hypothetical protein
MTGVRDGLREPRLREAFDKNADMRTVQSLIAGV